MDAERFDGLTKRLRGAQTRRGVLTGLGAAGLGLVPAALRPAESVAKKRKKRKKTCKPACSSCQACKKGVCANLPDNETTCKTGGGADGLCLGGVCGIPLQCAQLNQPCSTGSPGVCCSGVCNPVGPGVGICAQGSAGRPCFTVADCLSGKCAGFVCQ
jgi:hypothetical protein